ncbi:hypothetical protein BJ684DRAFT_20609 [Piptocephalis cylindrospora]|uniref:Uncharacterized protein n=1 Tax=Piptocephalis cylindrospora TaxID=1907219 RepID=A0A4P9Y4X1_9FUNG|nr:hypothetical protein BJ684DRAFT_20609 [Piptocephalis cylindrospora]|eukprot:RKP12870.1 hypothetical protein BJ684DRAFT_20609 [Piptocephalis cylindrospora]
MTITALTLEPIKAPPPSPTQSARPPHTSIPTTPTRWNQSSPLASTIPLSMAIALPLLLGLIGVLSYAWATKRASDFPSRARPFPTLLLLIIVPCILLTTLGLREALAPVFPCAFSLWSTSILLPMWLLTILLLSTRRVLALRYARADREGMLRAKATAKGDWAWAERELDHPGLAGRGMTPVLNDSEKRISPTLVDSLPGMRTPPTPSDPGTTPPLAPPPSTAIAAAALHRRIEQACQATTTTSFSSSPSPPSPLSAPPPIPSSTRRNTRLSILGDFADLCSRTFRPSPVPLELPEAASVSRTTSMRNGWNAKPQAPALPAPTIQLYGWEYRHRHCIRGYGLGRMLGVGLILHLVMTMVVQVETWRYGPERTAKLMETCRGGWEYLPMLISCVVYLSLLLPFLMHLAKPLTSQLGLEGGKREEDPWREFWGWMGVSFLLTLLAALLSFAVWVGPLGLLMMATAAYLGTLGMGIALPYSQARRGVLEA